MDFEVVDDDFIDFMDHVNDRWLRNVPRVLRDVENPLELFDDENFIKRFRFNKFTIVNQILPLIIDDNDVEDDFRGLPVPPIIKLLTALRFYATGTFQIVCGDLIKISQPSVSRIIKDVSEKIARHLPRFISFPQSENEKNQIKDDFFQMRRFLNVLGCIDCTHIPIKSTGGDNAEFYRNRKGWMSLNVQAVVGPQLQFLDLVIRWPGSAHDSRIFNNSSVKMRFEDGDLKNSFLLGDSGYKQTKYLYTPVKEPRSIPEERYNVAHKGTRVTVERGFGVLKRRFPCLSMKLRTKLRTTTRVIAACFILHNIGRVSDPRDFPLRMSRRDWEDLVVDARHVRESDRGQIIKNTFIQRHFSRQN